MASGFTVADLELEALPSRSDWSYEVTWRPLGDEPIKPGVRPPVPSGTWLVVGPDERLGDLAATLAARDIPLVRLDTAALLDTGDQRAAEAVDAAIGAAPTLSHVVFAASPGHPVDAAGDATRAFLHLLQLVTARTWERTLPVSPQVWIVTAGGVPVGGPVSSPADGALWGMARTLAAELPMFYGGVIDVDDADDLDGAAIADLVTSSGDETWLARRGGTTYVARLVAAPPSAPHASTGVGPGAHLVTGGFGALGLATAHALVARGARRLVLAGRSPVPPRETWSALAADDPARARVDAIRALEAAGASVHVAAIDVADRDALARFLADYRAAGWPPIRGVFHAAGVLRDRSISDMSDDDVAEVLSPKVAGTWNLHELLDEPLDHFVMFSSAAGLLGSPGQINYAAGNAFMDAVAHLRRAEGRPGLSVDWGAWAAGMADREDLARQRGRQGQLAIPVDAGMAVLFDLMAVDATQAMVLPMTARQLAAGASSPLLSELVESDAAGSIAEERRDRGAEIIAAAAEDRLAMTLDLLRTRIGMVLGADPDAVEPLAGLIELGLDSIMVVEMATKLSVDLGIGLNPREVFKEASVQTLATTLLAALEQRSAGHAGTGSGPGAGSFLVVAAPGSGVAELRAALAAATGGAVAGDDAVPTAAAFADPAVVLCEDLAGDRDALDALVDQLPSIHVVHLARHPFAVIDELTPTLGRASAEETWRTANGNLLDLAERLGAERVRMIRVEDLVEGGAALDTLLGVLGLARDPSASPAIDEARLDGWRTVDIGERPGRGVRTIAEELGYDTTWPVVAPPPTRGSGV
jgi:NADP-dependent 3-hydroxy acid dehydrogenase YdfG/acyl carrier protein